MAMKYPIVLVSAASRSNISTIVKGITKDNQESLTDNGTIWNIINKYYKTSVKLLPLDDARNVEDIDWYHVEALIIHIDSLTGESLATAKERKTRCEDAINSNVNILLCDNLDSLSSREQAVVWCLENNFELIDLSEEPEPTDAVCPIEDHYGIDRVIYTLHTNTWSNHEMIQNDHHNNLHDLDEEYVADDEDCLEHMDQFCKLFSQMSSVATNAAAMSTENRKSYAEQVVKAFWKAIDGDDSELDENSP